MHASADDALGHAPASRVVERWLRRCARVVEARRTWLTELDAAIGDGDHGINLDRGFAGVVADLDAAEAPTTDPGLQLTVAGRRVMGLVGGASGALYGRGLIRAGERLTASPGTWGVAAAVAALEAAIDGIVALGHAAPGDKTMLDALVPALESLRREPPDAEPGSALARAADAAAAGAHATIPMVARRGRASYLGERSAGHLDPGAASSAILLRCLADEVAQEAAPS